MKNHDVMRNKNWRQKSNQNIETTWESEEDSSDLGDEGPARKKSRPHRERDEPIISRSYLKLKNIFTESVSGVCSLMSYFTSKSTSKLDMAQSSSSSKNLRFKMSASSKASNSKRGGAEDPKTDGDYTSRSSSSSNNNSIRRNYSTRASRSSHVPSRISNDDDVQFLGITERKVPINQPTRRPALSRRSTALEYDKPSTPVINPNFRFSPAVSPIARPPTPHVKPRPTPGDPGWLKSSLPSEKASAAGRKPVYLDKNPVKSVQERCFGIRKKKQKNLKSTFLLSRGNSSAEESFRFEEKMRYRQMLQQFTNTSVLPNTYSVYQRSCRTPSVCSSTSSFGLVSRSRCNYLWTQDKRRHIGEKLGSSASSSALPADDRESGMNEADGNTATPAVEVIDLVKSQSTSSCACVNSCENSKDSETESVIFVEEVKKPLKHGNSLEQILQESSIYSKDWVKNLREKYETQSKNEDVEIEFASQRQRKLTEKRIQQQNSLEDRITHRLKYLDLSFPSKVEEIPPELEVEPQPQEFIQLTPEMEDVIDSALKKFPASEVLVDKFNIQITRRDIATLSGLNWVNDEIINFYMNLIMERGKNDNFRNVYAFNTFFYPKLIKSCYQSVRRWTKKVDVFTYDLLLVPVHLGMHWCLATIDFQTKSIQYYDSMLGTNDQCLEALLDYLISEHEDKKKSPYNASDWILTNVKSIPQQMNGSDCGMFACKFAEYLSRNAPITFQQQHMPYFRRRMVYEIVNATLM
ncbi:sentrin-specific protease 1-like isoform X3 [Cherax quadricarinatus]|uniref:sentrin-specific protease 1-like isoform X3 n=1 Tax=Cherax quadricarinatus TaxID=27406 RepID=UPI00387E6E78